MLPPPTARLRFREMVGDDLDSMAALLGDPDVMRFYPAPKSRDEAAAWIARNRQRYEELGHGLWIVELHDGTFVGDCGLTQQPVGDRSVLEVGYHVRPELQGSGLATEAATACRDLARSVGEPRLAAIIHVRNRASQRVAEKLGMLVEERDRGNLVYAMTL